MEQEHVLKLQNATARLSIANLERDAAAFNEIAVYSRRSGFDQRADLYVSLGSKAKRLADEMKEIFDALEK